MLGAVQEQWYPPNKDTGSTGTHLAFPQGKWYPNNEKYHYSSLLQFHSNANWQFEALDYVDNTGYCYQIIEQGCKIWRPNYEPNWSVEIKSQTKEAIFEALYQMSQYLKENK